MGSAASVVIDVLSALWTSLDFCLDLDFRVFFARALIYVVSPLNFSIDMLERCCAMKVSARRTACLRPSGGVARSNRADALGDAVGLNCHEFRRGPSWTWKAVPKGLALLQTSRGFLQHQSSS